MKQDLDYNVIKELLSSPKKIVISTHRGPDGDAVGSSLALKIVLNKLGHDACVIVPNDYPNFLRWLPEQESVINFENKTAQAKELISSAEIIFTLDYNDLSRIKPASDDVAAASAVKIMIDHHLYPKDYADHTMSDTSACSTAQLIYDFIEGIGALEHLNKEVAACIYTGIVTDSGSFRFSSTSKRTHYIAGELIDRGLVVDEVHVNIYDNNRLSKLKLLGYCLSEKLEMIEGFPVAFIALSQNDLAKFEYQSGDTEGVVNYALSLNGVKMAAMIKESDEGPTRLSLRSKGDLAVNDIAGDHFSGGGHKNAAGGSSDLTFEETVTKFKTIIPSYAERFNN